MLVVDDDEISRTAHAGLLRSLGLAVDVTVNGQEALETSALWPYVAIFMDCEMPEVDGYTAVTQLHRREGVNLHTPVIAVTTRPQWVSLAAGMDHHIAKPLGIDELRTDCRRLGLLASERDDSVISSPDPGADAPLLDDSVFGPDAAGYRLTKARHAAAFVEQAVVRLPEMWRAANAGDVAALGRLALALQARAETVGAARVSMLCDQMSQAAARSAVAIAASFETPLRRAVADTGAAISAWVDGTEPPAMAQPQGSDPSRRGESAAPEVTPSAVPARVLLADDDPVARVALAEMLTTADWIEFVGEADGVQAIVDLAAAEQPDVVVLDWLMPDGGGAEAARRILGQKVDTVIVGVTASESLEALTDMISAGASCLVSKGGSAAQLTQTIARALKASMAARTAADEHETEPPQISATPSVENACPSIGPLDPTGIQTLRTEFESAGILGELVELFGSQTPEHLIQLRHAIDAGDSAAVSGHAHQLKGGCLTLAANQMAEICDELEQSSRAGSLTGARALADQLQEAFQQAYAALRQEVS